MAIPYSMLRDQLEQRLRQVAGAYANRCLGENGLTLGVGGVTVAEALRQALEEDNP